MRGGRPGLASVDRARYPTLMGILRRLAAAALGRYRRSTPSLIVASIPSRSIWSDSVKARK